MAFLVEGATGKKSLLLRKCLTRPIGRGFEHLRLSPTWDERYRVARNEVGGLERVQYIEVLMPNISWDINLKKKVTVYLKFQFN